MGSLALPAPPPCPHIRHLVRHEVTALARSHSAASLRLTCSHGSLLPSRVRPRSRPDDPATRALVWRAHGDAGHHRRDGRATLDHTRMTDADVRYEGVNVVLVGSFNPAIMSPGWLFAQGLVSEQEHDDAQPEAIVPSLSIFTVTSIRFQVSEDTFKVDTENQREFERTRDMATSLLTILPHTPVNMLGINHYFHAALPSHDAWHLLGDRLVNKDQWKPLLSLPGTRDVTLEGVRPDRFAGSVIVSIQPSGRVEQGVFVSQNDHYLLREVDRQPQSRSEFLEPRAREAFAPPTPSSNLVPVAKKILTECWSASHNRAEEILRLVNSLAEAK